jgi:hypothetical protein
MINIPLNRILNFKRSIFFVGFLIILISQSFSSEYGEDLKGECIATLPDSSRYDLIDIKENLEEIEEEEGTSTPTDTKSK